MQNSINVRFYCNLLAELSLQCFYLLHAFCAFVAFQALTTTATPNDNYICAIPLTAPPEPIHIPVGVQTKSDYMNTELGQRVCKEYPIEARSLRFHLHIYSYIHLHTLTHTNTLPQLHLHPQSSTSKRICVQSLLYSLSLTPSYVSASYVYRKP